ncbi:MAG: thioredoxin [Chitinophagaceae bacterium]|nr:thioredoxin [Chitinophagaceae bacterium]
MMEQVKETFDQIIGSSTPVLVDFYADWCGPCKAMNPIIKEVADSLKGKVRVVKVNIDKAVAAANKYQVQAVPTFAIFKNGQIVWRHSGMVDKAGLLRAVDSSLTA